jgi:hypothetical protein
MSAIGNNPIKGGRAAPSEEATQAFMALVRQIPCERHNALSGQPCWAAPTKGVCGQRIAQAASFRTGPEMIMRSKR